MNTKEFLDGFKQENFDYQNPDFNNMGSWPAAIKLSTIIVLSIAIVFGFYWFAVKDSTLRHQRAVAVEPGLKDQYRAKSFQVANLDGFKAQLEDMKESFSALLAQLPNDTEMPGLLDDISTTAAQSGLQLDEIVPKADAVKEFYIETPIGIIVRGSYHEMGTFVGSMSAISRIVTQHDFILEVLSNSADESATEAPLKMTILAKTYRYKGDSNE